MIVFYLLAKLKNKQISQLNLRMGNQSVFDVLEHPYNL